MNEKIGQVLRSNGASSNPLANWSNDDLLLTDGAQRMVATASPRAFRVLDWPRLREEFQRHDKLANEAKKGINGSGMIGVSMSALGASLLAMAPLFPTEAAQSAIVVGGCIFVLVGCLVGLWHFLGHSGKARWLLGRVWTERLRQFYFQYLINNFDEAIVAMRDDAALANYRTLRDGALSSFVDDLDKSISARSFAAAMDWLADDHDDARGWGEGVWATCRVSPGAMTRDHVELCQCLSQRRIGIQEIYARLNLKSGARSQAGMAHRISSYGNIATLVFVVSLTLAGILILISDRHERLAPDVLVAVSGIAAACGLYLRLVDQGMGYSLDTERYELYAEQVDLVRRRFDAAADDIGARIEALRQLEIYSYREMRQFLRTHFRSRFLG